MDSGDQCCGGNAVMQTYASHPACSPICITMVTLSCKIFVCCCEFQIDDRGATNDGESTTNNNANCNGFLQL